ncbi:hypothetical protein AB0H76_09835 [Nocardia sp. NPDC050712]|uniref:hypothetical protein n=1 Tax=Nocardia sp. NPDC050712 TaxID=3155518 RepID=UPI0034019FAE
MRTTPLAMAAGLAGIASMIALTGPATAAPGGGDWPRVRGGQSLVICSAEIATDSDLVGPNGEGCRHVAVDESFEGRPDDSTLYGCFDKDLEARKEKIAAETVCDSVSILPN